MPAGNVGTLMQTASAFVQNASLAFENSPLLTISAATLLSSGTGATLYCLSAKRDYRLIHQGTAVISAALAYLGGSTLFNEISEPLQSHDLSYFRTVISRDIQALEREARSWTHEVLATFDKCDFFKTPVLIPAAAAAGTGLYSLYSFSKAADLMIYDGQSLLSKVVLFNLLKGSVSGMWTFVSLKAIVVFGRMFC